MDNLGQNLTAAKAWVASTGAAITAGAASLMAAIPNNDTVQVVGTIAVAVVGSIVTAFATFKVPNVPKGGVGR